MGFTMFNLLSSASILIVVFLLIVFLLHASSYENAMYTYTHTTPPLWRHGTERKESRTISADTIVYRYWRRYRAKMLGEVFDPGSPNYLKFWQINKQNCVDYWVIINKARMLNYSAEGVNK